MYRGQDIGDRRQLVEKCLHILEKGNPSELYDILPHISIVRAPEFLEPLLNLLKKGERSQQEFAALALGSLADPRCTQPLLECFLRPETLRGARNQSLQTSIIVALGETGHEESVEPLLRIYHLDIPQDQFRSRRRRLVLSSLGSLALQGSRRAEKELSAFLKDPDASIRAHAVTELATAYWHRAQNVPAELLEQMFELSRDKSENVSSSALSGLSNLAHLGCNAAEEFLRQEQRGTFKES